MTTIHAYTATQKTVDGVSAKEHDMLRHLVSLAALS